MITKIINNYFLDIIVINFNKICNLFDFFLTTYLKIVYTNKIANKRICYFAISAIYTFALSILFFLGEKYMTFQKSLKLTALGLGIASIALTGCNNKSNDGKNGANGTNGIIGKDGEVKETPHLTPGAPDTLTKYETTSSDGKGNTQSTTKYDDMTKGTVEIVTSGTQFPSNYCMPFAVKYTNSLGEVESLDISALYDKLDGNHNSDIQVVLDSASKLKFKIVGNLVCPKGLYDDVNTNLSNGPTSQTNAFSSHSLVKLRDEATILVRYKGSAKKLAEKTFTVVDSQINSIHAQANHIIADGLVSKPFKIYGLLVGRNGNISDSRNSEHSAKLAEELYNSFSGRIANLTLAKAKTLPIIELTGTSSDVSLTDEDGKQISITYNDKLNGWIIDGKDIPVSAAHKAYRLEVTPKDKVRLALPSLELKIQKTAAVVESYELVGIHTNLHGRKGFDIKAKFTDGTVKSIYNVEEGKTSPFSVKYKVKNLANNSPVTSIDIYSDVLTGSVASRSASLLNATDTPAHVKNFNDKLLPRYIDVTGTPDFSASSNNFYELDIEITYNHDYLASGVKQLTPSEQLKVNNESEALYNAVFGKNVNSVITRRFIVSDIAPKLKLEYKYFDDTNGSNLYNKSIAALRDNAANNAHGKYANSASLPQGGIAFDVGTKAGHICVKAISTLEFYAKGSTTPVVVDNYRHIARFYVGSEVLTNKNESFTSAFDNETDGQKFENATVICAKEEAKVGSFELESEFQNLKSNKLSLHAVPAIKSPVISFVYDKASENTFHAFPYNKTVEKNGDNSVKFHEIKLVPYYLLSNRKLGDKLSDSEASQLRYEVAQSRKNDSKVGNNNSPMFIREKTNASYLTLNYGPIDSTEQQAQYVQFASDLNHTYVFSNSVYYSGVNSTVLEKNKALIAIVNADPSKKGFFKEDNWNTNHRETPKTKAELDQAVLDIDNSLTAQQAIINGTQGLIDAENREKTGADQAILEATQQGLFDTADSDKKSADQAVITAKGVIPLVQVDVDEAERLAGSADTAFNNAQRLLNEKKDVETKAKAKLAEANQIKS